MSANGFIHPLDLLQRMKNLNFQFIIYFHKGMTGFIAHS